MLDISNAFSGFSVLNVKDTQNFYENILGLKVDKQPEGLEITIAPGTTVFAYEKPNHTAASFTILNFVVKNIDGAVDSLSEQGIQFEQYGGEIQTDEKGIHRGKSINRGPNIAWFKDPSGNILGLMES